MRLKNNLQKMLRIIQMIKEIERFFYTILYFGISFVVKIIQFNYELYRAIFKK